MSNRVAIAKLPTKDVAAGEKAVVTGWGSVSGPNSGGSRNIKKLTVNILSHEECQDSMPYFAKPDPSYICTFVEEGAGACEVCEKMHAFYEYNLLNYIQQVIIWFGIISGWQRWSIG